MRSKPWVYGLKRKYTAKGLKLIGVHTPEENMEGLRERVIRTAKMYLCDYPILLDNDGKYWGALKVNFWPSYFLVDRKGNIVKMVYGEMQKGQPRADDFMAAVDRLMDGVDGVKP